MSRRREPVIDRLMRYIETDANGCWLWTSVCYPTGYARLDVDGTSKRAHRLMYEESVGPIPDGLTLDHNCHNADLGCPGGYSCHHRRCVNPAHLEPVTNLENHRRRAGRKGNQTIVRGNARGAA